LGDHDTVNVTKGNDTINVTTDGNSIVSSVKGGVQINESGAVSNAFNLRGNDTITLGTGNDTVTDPGGATVFGGAGNLLFQGGSKGTDDITLGSGNATINAGGGDNIVHAGSGNASISATAKSSDTFFGATGHDTMSAPGAKSAVFSFTSTLAGGTHTISSFTSGPDKLQLTGYDTTSVLNNAQIIGGSTLLNLGDGTTINLVGFTGLKASDFTP
jgi:hypothetical protein